MADVLARRIRKRGCDRRVAAPLASEQAGHRYVRTRICGKGAATNALFCGTSSVAFPSYCFVAGSRFRSCRDGGGARCGYGTAFSGTAEVIGCFGSSSAKARVQWEAERYLSIAGGRPGGLFCRREHRSFGRYFVLSVIYSVIFFVSLYQDRDSFRFCKSNESRFRACYFLNPNEEKEKSAMKAGRDGFCRGSR